MFDTNADRAILADEMLKAEAKAFSKSETEFFGTPRDFKKNYLKPLLKKKL